MLRKLFISAVLACYAVGVCFAECGKCGRDHEGRCPVEEQAPVFVTTVLYGTALGAFTGLAWGWVRYADRYEMQNVWNSVGYGAFGGCGLGLTAAIIDPVKGGCAIADLDAIGSVGTSAGFLWGITSALFTGDSKRIASSAAWGQLSGMALGFVAVGYKLANDRYDAPSDDKAMRCSVGCVQDSAYAACPVVQVRKRF